MLRVARRLRGGDYRGAFGDFGLNPYIVILAELRHIDPDWTVTGKWWSVIMATLTVLPLWGWIRRQFDDRVALVACLCYAFHGKLVAITPLIIRDPTFWFLFALTLYLMWRAVVELRIWRFLAAGLSLTLAIHTRTEGWMLVVPLLGWVAGRWPAAAGHRARLILGSLLCLAMIPSLMALVNMSLPADQRHWEIVRTQHVQIAQDWWRSIEPVENAPPPDPGVQAAQESIEPAERTLGLSQLTLAPKDGPCAW